MTATHTLEEKLTRPGQKPGKFVVYEVTVLGPAAGPLAQPQQPLPASAAAAATGVDASVEVASAGASATPDSQGEASAAAAVAPAPERWAVLSTVQKRFSEFEAMHRLVLSAYADSNSNLYDSIPGTLL